MIYSCSVRTNHEQKHATNVTMLNKPNTKEYLLLDSIHINSQNRQNQPTLLEIRIVVTLGDVVTIREHEGGFQGTGNIFC